MMRKTSCRTPTCGQSGTLEAFKGVKEGTLVYAIHCYVDVYKAISAGPRPAVLIGTDVGNFGRFGS